MQPGTKQGRVIFEFTPGDKGQDQFDEYGAAAAAIAGSLGAMLVNSELPKDIPADELERRKGLFAHMQSAKQAGSDIELTQEEVSTLRRAIDEVLSAYPSAVMGMTEFKELAHATFARAHLLRLMARFADEVPLEEVAAYSTAMLHPDMLRMVQPGGPKLADLELAGGALVQDPKTGESRIATLGDVGPFLYMAATIVDQYPNVVALRALIDVNAPRSE